MGIPAEHVRVAKVVGENEDGLTLFVPKDLQASFSVEEGDRFLTFIFTRNHGDGTVETWIPWEL